MKGNAEDSKVNHSKLWNPVFIG